MTNTIKGIILFGEKIESLFNGSEMAHELIQREVILFSDPRCEGIILKNLEHARNGMYNNEYEGGVTSSYWEFKSLEAKCLEALKTLRILQLCH